MGETVEVWDCLSGPTHVASKENVWSTRGAKQATIQEDQYRHLVHRSRLCGHFSSADQHSSSPEDALFKLSRLFFLLSVFLLSFIVWTGGGIWGTCFLGVPGFGASKFNEGMALISTAGLAVPVTFPSTPKSFWTSIGFNLSSCYSLVGVTCEKE